MSFSFSSSSSFSSWLIPAGLVLGAVLFLSGCGCCGRGSCHARHAPCHDAVFEERSMPAGRRSYTVDITKQQPGRTPAKGRVVLLMHEVNGQSPGTLWLAKALGDAGCRVYVPRLFGGYGSNHGLLYTPRLICTPWRWHLFNATNMGGIRAEMWALTEAIAKENPGRKMTVIGSCITGSLPLELLQNEHVDTAIMCQPAMPFITQTRARARSLGLPPEVVGRSLKMLADDPHKRLINFNYLGDRVGVIERCQFLAEQTQHGRGAARHEMYIGVGPPNGRYLSRPDAKAVPPGARVLHTVTHNGHSTITGAKNAEDLQLFQDQLFQVLGLKGGKE